MGEFELVSCSTCSAAWVTPVPSGLELDAYYREVYSAPHHSATRARAIASELSSRIRKLNPAARSVLDFGGGDGMIGAELARHGFDITVVEPEDAARTQAAARGLRTAVNITELGPRRFDVVLMRHVLEHLTEPAAAVTNLSQLLTPREGLLGIGVPNFDCLPRKLIGPAWEWFSPPAQLFYFNRRSLRALLQAAGLAPVDCYAQRGDAVPLPLALLAGPIRVVLRRQKPPGWWKAGRGRSCPARRESSQAGYRAYAALQEALARIWPWGDEELWIWASRK
jgi:2-polyprenyl-3-methyl-5-hydroxy-6-metoxy-1,4-benzoquinol methylase